MQSSYIPERLHIPQKPNGQFHDVSPPDSLLGHEANQSNSRRSSPDVSPVTENSSPIVERPPVNGKHTSSIPVLKKTQRFGSTNNKWTNWRGRATEVKTPDNESSSPAGTRWDDYSGERTTSEKGKPGQVTPGSVPFISKPGQVVRPLAFGNTTTITGGHAPVRRKRVPSREENFTPAVREEWKGASGRHKIINPLVDKPLPPGIKPVFPTGSQRLSESPTELRRTRDAISPTSGLALSAISDEPTPTQETFVQPSIKVDEDDQIESPGSAAIASPISIVTPLNRQPEPTLHSKPIPEIDTLFQNQPNPTANSLSPLDRRSPLTSHPSSEAMKQKPQPPTPGATPDHWTEHEDLNLKSNFSSDFHNMNLTDQPPSRFSATTYATTAYNSPPATPETTHESPTQTPPSSILNRKRPVPTAGVNLNRKPTPSSHSTDQTGKNRHTNKSLPKSPPEVEAPNRIASLQATLEGLRRRKANIQTVLHELTNVVQPSSVAYDIAAKKQIRMTVEGLERELAEIRKEEHETGLKLHRAWKRADGEAEFEPTTLWVRRVTT